MTVYGLSTYPGELSELLPSSVGMEVLVATQATTHYMMRRSDTAQSSGYAFWQNSTGDATGAPSSSGTTGSPVVLGTYVK